MHPAPAAVWNVKLFSIWTGYCPANLWESGRAGHNSLSLILSLSLSAYLHAINYHTVLNSLRDLMGRKQSYTVR
jgi:hypothetical protein